MDHDLERNKKSAMAFYDLMFNHWDVLQVVPPQSLNDNTMF